MKYLCNPININYRYQFNAASRPGGKLQICREAADPSMICFQDRYYIFASMTLGVWVSDDLVSWENHRLPDSLPLYDYAPDVRVMGDYVYFSASKRDQNCDRWRTRDILNGPYEKIEGNFPFWDPNLFIDDDGRVYFYWGCSNATPIWGVELDPVTMLPAGEKISLIEGHPREIGFERPGENNAFLPASDEEVEAAYQDFLKQQGGDESSIPPEFRSFIRGLFRRMPFIEGAWMDKHNGRYYLQYACPGTEYNTYSNGVYVSDHPLGPFALAENNPYSYKPGGFLPGAGHGSTMRDREGNWWHTATMRISVNHDMERRVGLWPAGFDPDGELFCNQRYGDWPMPVSGGKQDPWRNPEWMLLSAGKNVSASSFREGYEPGLAVKEDIRSWWKPAAAGPDEWLCLDLGKVMDVRLIQINFADDYPEIPCPGPLAGGMQARYIDPETHPTRWMLEGSTDGKNWTVIADKTQAQTDLSHDQVLMEQGMPLRFLRLSKMTVPYGQIPCVSGFRVFGLSEGQLPAVPDFSAVRTGDLDMNVSIRPQDNTVGYDILFGHSPEKLYHSWMTFVPGDLRIGALIKGRNYFVRVDAFNESGITEGRVIPLA